MERTGAKVEGEEVSSLGRFCPYKLYISLLQLSVPEPLQSKWDHLETKHYGTCPRMSCDW